MAFLIFLLYNRSLLRSDEQAASIQEKKMEMIRLDQENQLMQLRKYNDSLTAKLIGISLVSDSLALSSPALQPLASQIKNLEESIAKQQETLLALRQAIDPQHPEEILTIARLKDQLRDIQQKLADTDTRIKEKQLSFEEAVKREMNASNQSTTAIIIIMIPLVLNLVYTGIKDFRSSREKTQTVPVQQIT